MKNIIKSKIILLSTFILTAYCLCFSNHIFPNEKLYKSRPSSGFSYSDQTIEYFINARFPIDTFFSYKVQKPLLAGLIQTESSFYIHAISDSNALGLFQMKPFIAKEINIMNPFNPKNEKKISKLLDNYTSIFGNVDYALGAYRIGFYGVREMLDSGKNPMDDMRIKDYVQKIHSFQRLYKEGDKIPLKDYVWFDFCLGLSEENYFSSHLIIPEYSIGSIAIGIAKERDIKVSIYQDFSFFYFLSFYLAYDDGMMIGVSLRSDDWYDQINVKYDFYNEDLTWSTILNFNFLRLELNFSATSIMVKPIFIIRDRFFVEIPLAYSDFLFKPGIGFRVRF